jgi:hypothetical protein
VARKLEGKVAFITGAARYVTGVTLPIDAGLLIK